MCSVLRGASIVLLTLFLIFCCACSAKVEPYTIAISQDESTLTIYDHSGLPKYVETYPSEIHSKLIASDIVQFTLSTGSPSTYCFFLNISTREVTDVFFNPIVVDGKFIAYMDKGVLTISSLLDHNRADILVKRDFSPAADPISSVIGIDLVDERSLILQYYSGDTFSHISEEIPLL